MNPEQYRDLRDTISSGTAPRARDATHKSMKPKSDSNNTAGAVDQQRLVLPLMMLDESMPETHMVPIHPETGEVWGEKQCELVELATAWRYESDDDLRKEAEAEYIAAKKGVTFAERPFFKQSSFILGAAYKDVTPREVYHCHPKTWEKVPDDAKDKFEVRVQSEYSFLGQNDQVEARRK